MSVLTKTDRGYPGKNAENSPRGEAVAAVLSCITILLLMS